MYDNPHMDSYLSDEQDGVDLGGAHLGSLHTFGGHMGLGDDMDSDEKALLGTGKRKVLPLLRWSCPHTGLAHTLQPHTRHEEMPCMHTRMRRCHAEYQSSCIPRSGEKLQLTGQRCAARCRAATRRAWTRTAGTRAR